MVDIGNNYKPTTNTGHSFQPAAYITRTDSLKDPDKFQYYMEMMPEFRKERLRHFKHDEDKHMSLAAFSLLLKALGNIGISSDDIKIRYEKNEKPYLEDQNIYFNLSHSDNVAACVISPYEIGCDVEHADDHRIIIAKKKFCRSEYELLLKEEDIQKQNLLFSRIWTVKESVLKALGTGLALPLNSFNVSFDTDEIHVRSESIKADLYYKEYPSFDDFSFSICCMERSGLPKAIEYIEL